MSQQNPNLTQEQILRMLDPLSLTQNYNTQKVPYTQGASETIDLILGNPTLFNALKQWNKYVEGTRVEGEHFSGSQGATGSSLATGYGGSDRNAKEGR